MGKHHWKVEKQPEWYVKAVRKTIAALPGGYAEAADWLDVTESRCTGQRSSEVCFRSEDIRDERESVGNQRRILKNGCRIVRQFGGVIGIICVCFKR